MGTTTRSPTERYTRARAIPSSSQVLHSLLAQLVDTPPLAGPPPPPPRSPHGAAPAPPSSVSLSPRASARVTDGGGGGGDDDDDDDADESSGDAPLVTVLRVLLVMYRCSSTEVQRGASIVICMRN